MESFSKTGCLSVRAAVYAKYQNGLSPGPAVYESKSAVGRQVSSQKKSAPTPGFGTAPRAGLALSKPTPSPDKYTVHGSMGKQPTDKARTAPAFGFGSSLQRPRPQTADKLSQPGPGAYSMPTSVGRQVVSTKASSKNVKVRRRGAQREQARASESKREQARASGRMGEQSA